MSEIGAIGQFLAWVYTVPVLNNYPTGWHYLYSDARKS